jgi:hypothetical protein
MSGGGRGGYNSQHKALRDHWKPTVDAGQAWCHATRCLMPTRWIPPGTPWDLGHTPDRSGWTGPEHSRCNRSAGQAVSAELRRGVIPKNWPPRRRRAVAYTRVGKLEQPTPQPLRTSRQW